MLSVSISENELPCWHKARPLVTPHLPSSLYLARISLDHQLRLPMLKPRRLLEMSKRGRHAQHSPE